MGERIGDVFELIPLHILCIFCAVLDFNTNYLFNLSVDNAAIHLTKSVSFLLC